MGDDGGYSKGSGSDASEGTVLSDAVRDGGEDALQNSAPAGAGLPHEFE